MQLYVLFLLSAVGAFEWPWEDSSSSSTASASSSSLITGDGRYYAPRETECPSYSLTRSAEGISQDEETYIGERRKQTQQALSEFLDNVKGVDFSIVQDHNVSIALAFSGGGYRAMLNGAGQLLGMDSRFEAANKSGLGGLLQSAEYIGGLSGGGWLVGSLVLNDWLSVGDVWEGSSTIWQLDDSIFNVGGLKVWETAQYYTNISSAVQAKNDSGYPITVTDVWGRALSYQFYEGSNKGDGRTWSGVAQADAFTNHSMPYPILVANGRTPGTLIINENSTVFELTPYETGSWDPSLRTFARTKFLGSNGSTCVAGFDDAGFFMGTSSSLFNQALVRVSTGTLNSIVKNILLSILNRISGYAVDIAAYSPNPFHDSANAGVKAIVDDSTLYLVDGGEDLQNVPFYPFIQNARAVDVILGFDNSADTPQNWPNGSSIVATYKRQFAAQGKGTPFPFVPDEQTFVKDKLNERPVFFGCNANDMDGLVKWHGSSDATDIPLVVLFSNTRYSYDTNTSTFKMAYDHDEKFAILQNGFEVVSRGNMSDDSEWKTCIACAVVRRAQERAGEKQSDECKKCFEKYCWTGGESKAAYLPSGYQSASTSGASTASTASAASGAAAGTGTRSSSTSSKKGGASRISVAWLWLCLVGLL